MSLRLKKSAPNGNLLLQGKKKERSKKGESKQMLPRRNHPQREEKENEIKCPSGGEGVHGGIPNRRERREIKHVQAGKRLLPPTYLKKETNGIRGKK